MAQATLDHIIVAAATLAQGCDYVESGLGVRPQTGGRHVLMGTHNALLKLGPRLFLEVLSVDPRAPAPARPRWFDLDEPRMRASLTDGPRLVHHVARTDDIEALASGSPTDLGEILQLTRGDFRWRIRRLRACRHLSEPPYQADCTVRRRRSRRRIRPRAC